MVTTRSDQAQLEREPEQKGPRRSGRAKMRSVWNWFGVVFGIVVLLGVGILYLSDRSGPEIGEAEAAEQPVAAEEAEEQPAEPPASVAPVDEATDEAAEDSPIVIPGQTSAVLLGTYVVDSFGFHGMEEAYAEATEVGNRDAGQVAKVLAAVDAVDWPDELSEVAATFRGDVAGLHEAMEAGDVEGARLGLEAVHGSQHGLSNGVYAWLAGSPVGHDDGVEAEQPMEIIEIEMNEFAYAPETIDIKAGVPVILRFTNTGKLEHEAMVGDAHMQEEWASASTGGHDPTDGHHGDLMAVTVLPGETADLEVHIDEAGTWYMACHLVGHYEQGQVATINVTA